MNKRKIILICIAFILMGALGIAIQYSHYIESIILLIIIAVIVKYILKSENKEKQEEEILQEVIELKGEPEHIIITDPIHGYRNDGCILVYTQKKGFVIDGKWIPWEKIGSITFNNESLGYHLPNSYQIIMEIKSSPKRYIHIPTGNDMGWTQITLKEIQKAMGLYQTPKEEYFETENF